VLRRRPDEIDWSKLRGPYGTSEDVADALRDLWSVDSATRAEAVSFLQENLWHQRTVYEVTAPAVPFLADAALGDVVGRDDRIWLVLLLAWIADGTSYLDVHQGLIDGAIDRDELARELEWVRDARAAVRARLADFLRYLDEEDDPSVRVALAQLSAQFPEDGEESRPRLQRLVVAETDDLRRLVLQLALGAVGGHLDVDDALRRLPDEYYGDEDIVELRERFRSESETVVFRDIVDNISGAAITFDD
jgi:DNA-binding transcriptional ArsR family regulator